MSDTKEPIDIVVTRVISKIKNMPKGVNTPLPELYDITKEVIEDLQKTNIDIDPKDIFNKEFIMNVLKKTL